MTVPVRLPDAASLETVLAGLDPASADAEPVPALARALPELELGMARIDDDFWRDTRSMIRSHGTRLGELRPCMAELAKENGHIDALWHRLKETDLQITEWRGTSAFVFADRPGRGRLHPDRAPPRKRMAGGSGRQLRWADKPYGF
jgi:hypothetical protein